MFLSKTFEISEEEYNKIQQWDKEHECIYETKYGISKYCGAIGGHLSIEFMPTSLGEIVTVKCGCGKKLEVRGL